MAVCDHKLDRRIWGSETECSPKISRREYNSWKHQARPETQPPPSQQLRFAVLKIVVAHGFSWELAVHKLRTARKPSRETQLEQKLWFVVGHSLVYFSRSPHRNCQVDLIDLKLIEEGMSLPVNQRLGMTSVAQVEVGFCMLSCSVLL